MRRRPGTAYEDEPRLGRERPRRPRIGDALDQIRDDRGEPRRPVRDQDPDLFEPRELHRELRLAVVVPVLLALADDAHVCAQIAELLQDAGADRQIIDALGDGDVPVHAARQNRQEVAQMSGGLFDETPLELPLLPVQPLALEARREGLEMLLELGPELGLDVLAVHGVPGDDDGLRLCLHHRFLDQVDQVLAALGGPAGSGNRSDVELTALRVRMHRSASSCS